MAKYVIEVDYLTRMIFIEDNVKKTMHMFTWHHNGHSDTMKHRKYPLGDELRIVVPTYTTDVNPIGDGCPYNIYYFESFAAGLKATFGRKRK